jgi:hypothetical protein
MATQTHPSTKLPDFESLFSAKPCDCAPDQECDSDCPADSGISPRNAFALWFEAGQIHSGMSAALAECEDPHELMSSVFDALPPVCTNVDHAWLTQYAQCFEDIAARIALGAVPYPNSTAEELAMHQILEQLELHIDFAMITGVDHLDYFKDDRPGFQEAVAGTEPQESDLNLNLIEELLFEDTDVLMLFSFDTAPLVEGSLDASLWFDEFYI